MARLTLPKLTRFDRHRLHWKERVARNADEWAISFADAYEDDDCWEWAYRQARRWAQEHLERQEAPE